MSDVINVDIVDSKGEKTGTAALPAEIFDVETNIALMHQVVTAQLAAARQGTHATKTRGMVRRSRSSGFDPCTAVRRWWHRPRPAAA